MTESIYMQANGRSVQPISKSTARQKKLTTTVTKLVSYCYGQVIAALGLENLPVNGLQESQGFIRTNANN